ncbi:hypothetical protein D3C76_1695930 [compost metagenome]
MPEDHNTIEAIKNRLPVQLVNWEELKSIKDMKLEYYKLTTDINLTPAVAKESLSSHELDKILIFLHNIMKEELH